MYEAKYENRLFPKKKSRYPSNYFAPVAHNPLIQHLKKVDPTIIR